jgi:uncharacterized protein
MKILNGGNNMNKLMFVTIENYMHVCMKDSAHDPEHIFRVLYLSLNIASKITEEINFDILIASCLLHDIGREEQYKNPNICHAEIGGIMAKEFLLKYGWSEKDSDHVKNCISTHRFRGNNIPETLEAKILFDSDKLDAVGCLGISRTLMYKGIVGDNLYGIKDNKICLGENKNEKETFLKEYNFKLKNLYDNFYTKEAAEMAKKQKECAQLFYINLVDQIKEIYNSKEIINEYIVE